VKNLTKFRKKGAIIDAIPIIIYTFTFALVSVISYVIYQGFVDNGFYTVLNQTAPTANVSDLDVDAELAFTTLDFMVAFVFFGTTISALIGAILIRSHPAFFFISIILLMIQVLVSVAISNSWEEIITNDVMNEAEAKFTITNTILSNFPMFILIVVILLSIVLYALNPLGIE